MLLQNKAMLHTNNFGFVESSGLENNKFVKGDFISFCCIATTQWKSICSQYMTSWNQKKRFNKTYKSVIICTQNKSAMPKCKKANDLHWLEGV